MRDAYDVKSERYGHVHHFIKMPTGMYSYVPEQEWMPIYVTGEGDNVIVDTEGGPCVGLGFCTDEVRVIGVANFGRLGIEFKLEEINKTEE